MAVLLPLLLGASSFGLVGCKKKVPVTFATDGQASPWSRRAEAPSLTPAERTQPVAIVAPAPLPEGLPLKVHVSPSGKGPKEYVDQPGIRSLLYFKKYALLEAAFEAFQHRFETDVFDEELIFQAAGSFDSSENELQQQLDAWVAASPSSFAPYLARANHFENAGWDSRGGASAKETSDQAFARMKELHEKALADANKALELRPKLQAALRVRVKIAKGTSRAADGKAALDRAVKDCPTCFRVRFAYAFGLAPRWGGSYEAMDAFAKSAPVDKNPRLAILAGLADDDRATSLLVAKNYDGALAALDAATKHYDAATFAGARADVLHRKKDLAGALVAIDHALDLAPWDADLHANRAAILASSKRWKEAGEELLIAVRVDRTNDTAREYHAYIVEWLIWRAHEETVAKRRDAALDLLDVALALAPSNQYAAGAQSAAVLLGVDPKTDIPRLEADVKAKPDDFRTHQRLDYALAALNRFKEVIQMWDGYIARHPKDGRAHLERGGAHNRLGERDAAHADVKAACDLGISQGCIFAARASK